MTQHREAAEARRDSLLQALDLVILELEDQAALHADQVIVVIADDFVARLPVAELTLDRKAAIDEELQRSIDRRVADLRLTLADLAEQLVDRDVLTRAEELLDDRLALRRRVETTVRDVCTPAILELASVVRLEVRAFTHDRFSFPATARRVKRSRRGDFSVLLRYGPAVADATEPSFDAILVRLREVVQKLESGELSLEQSLAVYEEGVQLARKGQHLLASAEKRVEILVSASGSVETVPFSDEPGK